MGHKPTWRPAFTVPMRTTPLLTLSLSTRKLSPVSDAFIRFLAGVKKERLRYARKSIHETRTAFHDITTDQRLTVSLQTRARTPNQNG